MDSPTPNQHQSIKQRLQSLIKAGMGSLVIATASLAPPLAEATPSRNQDDAQRPAISDRVRDAREQIKLEANEQDRSVEKDGKQLLAWWNWRNWHNWRNWRN